MTCKDNCLHYEACINWVQPKILMKPIYSPQSCKSFKNKVDFEEVKHGEWIEEQGKSYLVSPMKYDTNGEPILQNYVIYKCSCCGRVENKLEPYCHCGARMDGKVNKSITIPDNYNFETGM